jgi:hypothetical protein
MVEYTVNDNLRFAKTNFVFVLVVGMPRLPATAPAVPLQPLQPLRHFSLALALVFAAPWPEWVADLS